MPIISHSYPEQLWYACGINFEVIYRSASPKPAAGDKQITVMLGLATMGRFTLDTRQSQYLPTSYRVARRLAVG